MNCKKPPDDKLEQSRENFNRVQRPAYIRDLATNHADQLLKTGFTNGDVKLMQTSGQNSQITEMAKNAEPPKNVEVHHRMPIECGGTNDLDNLTLVRKDVHLPLPESQMAGTEGLQYGQSR